METTIDNYDLWEMHDRKQSAQMDELPVCEVCGCVITTDKAVYYNDQWFCEDCEDSAWALIRDDYLESTTD